jgi:MoxR-like ATPase
VNSLLLGKQREVGLAFTTLLAGGHLLIEDLPGLGKTTLARSMAATLALDFQRMQFTSDLLPSDIIGVSIFDPERARVPLPSRAGVRAAAARRRDQPRAAAHAERAARGDGRAPGHRRRRLPRAAAALLRGGDAESRRPRRHLPAADSQLDRFLLRVQLGYPAAEAEREMLSGSDRRELIAQVMPQISSADLLACAAASPACIPARR